MILFSRLLVRRLYLPAVSSPQTDRGAHRIISREGHRRGKWSVVGCTMASAEHEPIRGVWGHSPQRGPGAEPLVRGSGRRSPLKLKAFWSLDVQRSRQI